VQAIALYDMLFGKLHETHGTRSSDEE